ncbi:hypothetical protein [Engelhardtia mirabilis]|uniref:Uncharacterized protein n=1 Tax=Engelhardtia mirabilis TaxID=2528011 RepID=A0A518BF44_9BACT|nr:hypothetical protein Pla133_06730 [Planctomycetes bacterium Pla133]QDU99933.1 hypothetical protein Pla86_06720 [Planctomycetes bacterium Pla86]
MVRLDLPAQDRPTPAGRGAKFWASPERPQIETVRPGSAALHGGLVCLPALVVLEVIALANGSGGLALRGTTGSLTGLLLSLVEFVVACAVIGVVLMGSFRMVAVLTGGLATTGFVGLAGQPSALRIRRLRRLSNRQGAILAGILMATLIAPRLVAVNADDPAAWTFSYQPGTPFLMPLSAALVGAAVGALLALAYSRLLRPLMARPLSVVLGRQEAASLSPTD